MGGDQSQEVARLRALEQLRSRPREPDDFPTLNAWFDHDSCGFQESGYRLIQLMHSLKGSNRFFETWRQDRSEQENRNATGIDPLINQNEYLEFQRSLGKVSDQWFSLSGFAFSSAIFPAEPHRQSIKLGYSGGLRMASNTLYVHPPVLMGSHNLTLQEWVGLIRVLLDWRMPNFVAVGSSNYEIYDRVFDHRAWPGWMAWFPTHIDPQHLPTYALTFDIGPGTLVATQETNVITTDSAQVERAKEVEIALGQLGILPTQDELLGRGN